MNANDILKYANGEVLKALDGFDTSYWETVGVCGVWSVKDILAHLASYEQWLIEILSSILDGGDIPTLQRMAQNYDGFNDDEVSARSHLTAAQVMAEYTDKQAQVMALAARLTPEAWRENGLLPWYGEQYSLDDFIVYTQYGHKREHMAQVNVFKDKLKNA